ncbi:MAG TPA: hypothetical protein VHP34_01780 [Alphaproteobacteria bacterium]|nr:hypothetical protein [Alphaproteobacteria bacterium]
MKCRKYLSFVYMLTVPCSLLLYSDKALASIVVAESTNDFYMYINYLNSLFWLTGLGLLNTAVFFFLYALYKRASPAHQWPYRYAYVPGCLWPLVAGIALLIMENLIARQPRWRIDDQQLLGIMLTCTFALIQFSFNALTAANTKKAWKLAVIYLFPGVGLISLPFIVHMLSSPIIYKP